MMTTWMQVLHSALDIPATRSRPVALGRGEILRLTGARGASVRVAAGSVWITEECRRDDIVLTPRGEHRIASGGRVVVASQPRARLVIEWPEDQAAPRIEVAAAEGAPGRQLGAADSRPVTPFGWPAPWRSPAAHRFTTVDLSPDAVRDRLAALVPLLRA
jgi:hypothetical protein